LASLIRANQRQQYPQTQLLEISVIDSDPYTGKVLADAVARQIILLSPSSQNKGDAKKIAFTKAQLTI